MSITDVFKRKQQLIKEVELSAEAKQIRDSPLMQSFFADAEAKAYQAWQSTPDDAYEARERLYLMCAMLRNFKQYFEGYMVQGQFAERALEEIIRQEELSSKKR